MAGGGSSPEPSSPSVRPQSPFVSRLRNAVEDARESEETDFVCDLPQIDPVSSLALATRRRSDKWAFAPSAVPNGRLRRVSFSEEALLPGAKTGGAGSNFVELRIKGSACKPFVLEAIDVSNSILDLKELCIPASGLPIDVQRLLYKGKLLQDGDLVADCKLPNKATIFLVKGVAATKEAQQQAANEVQAQKEEERLREEADRASVGFDGPGCVECGVNPGRPQTGGFCSICWREQVVKENMELKKKRLEAQAREAEAREAAERRRQFEQEREMKKQQDTSRCHSCRKKIGLTGFQCQCGYYYCAKHRYAEEHECDFDHRSRGREFLAQQAGSSAS